MRAHRTLDDVGVELDAAIVKKAGEAVPVPEAVADHPGRIRPTREQAIGRPKSTISRELSRNKLPSGRYSPLHAAGAYQLRRRREALIERDRALRTFVVDRLAEGSTYQSPMIILIAGVALVKTTLPGFIAFSERACAPA